MQVLGRRLALVVALVVGTVSYSSVTFGQTEPSPEETAAESAATLPTTNPLTTATEPTTPRTTTTLAPCEKTADPALTFVGHPIIRAETVVTFQIERVVTGNLTGVTVDVNFPLDDRFLFDGRPYRVTASYDAESKVFVSKVRPPRNKPAHCLAKDKIFTTHEDGSAIDTGIFAGMAGNWKFVPLDLLYPVAGAIGLLVVLVLLKRGVVLLLRSAFRWRSRRHEMPTTDF